MHSQLLQPNLHPFAHLHIRTSSSQQQQRSHSATHNHHHHQQLATKEILPPQLYAISPTDAFAMAIDGILDASEWSLPVRLVLLNDNDRESPEIQAVPNPPPPPPSELELLVVVENLEIGQQFVLCRYSDFDKVPTEKLWQCSESADEFTVIRATESSWSKVETILSSDTVIFRAALLPGPPGPTLFGSERLWIIGSWLVWFACIGAMAMLCAVACGFVGQGTAVTRRRKETTNSQPSSTTSSPTLSAKQSSASSSSFSIPLFSLLSSSSTSSSSSSSFFARCRQWFCCSSCLNSRRFRSDS
jgi:hypothetical protein